MLRTKLLVPVTALTLMVAPAFGQSSSITSSAVIPVTGSTPAHITLGIAAASTANDRTTGVYSSAYGATGGATLAANDTVNTGGGSARLRSSAR